MRSSTSFRGPYRRGSPTPSGGRPCKHDTASLGQAVVKWPQPRPMEPSPPGPMATCARGPQRASSCVVWTSCMSWTSRGAMHRRDAPRRRDDPHRPSRPTRHTRKSTIGDRPWPAVGQALGGTSGPVARMSTREAGECTLARRCLNKSQTRHRGMTRPPSRKSQPCQSAQRSENGATPTRTGAIERGQGPECRLEMALNLLDNDYIFNRLYSKRGAVFDVSTRNSA